ncbi:uncharacterized protein LOC108667964 [Hyalella azteca]|uniref:Uncharacterized protein LOC108667964 n=1 Tax=Hyalella azteca TaxID=294128 RepID=A0A8B7NAH0_HYAAZ|nr:uncharacterized protein LOC108667964 [Hyalella azteca]
MERTNKRSIHQLEVEGKEPKAQVQEWKNLFKKQRQESASSVPSSSKRKSEISQRRTAAVCLLCIENGCRNYSLVDMYPTTIDRHQKRNHPNDTFDKGKHIRCRDHEDVKKLEIKIEKLTSSSKQKNKFNPHLKNDTSVSQLSTEILSSTSKPDFSKRKSSSQPNFVQRDSPSHKDFVKKYSDPQPDFLERTPVGQSDFVECSPVAQTDFVERTPVGQPDFLERTPVAQPDFEVCASTEHSPKECDSSSLLSASRGSSFQGNSAASSFTQIIQKSIDGFLSIQPQNEVPRMMQPTTSKWTLEQIGECLERLESMLMKHLQKKDQGGPTTAKDNLSSICVLNACNNLNDVLSTKLFTLHQHQNKHIIRCSACHDYATRDVLITKNSTSFKLPTSGLSVGCKLPEAKIEIYKNGDGQSWYNFKSRLVTHLNSGQDSFHWKATQGKEEGASSVPRSVSVTETLCRVALHVLKMKGAALHYESVIALLKACKVDVGDIGHSRNNFPEILRAATVVICQRNNQMLLQPLLSTGLPPHFYITADKSTVNRHTNQAILLIVNFNGKRIAVPVGAPPVYSVDVNSVDDTTQVQLIGGSAVELADSIINTILEKTGLPDHHLTRLTGATCDGQYVVSSGFAARLAERVGVSSKSAFAVPVTWDAGHWMNLVVTDVRSVKQQTFKGSAQLLNTFIKRCNVFNDELQHGKGYAMLRAISESNKSTAHAPKSYAQHSLSDETVQLQHNLQMVESVAMRKPY